MRISDWSSDVCSSDLLDADNPRSVRLARKSLDGDDRLRLKVYSAVGPLALSDVVPALEHFGFEVLEEIPTTLGQTRAPGAEGADEPALVIHDFKIGRAHVCTPVTTANLVYRIP